MQWTEERCAILSRLWNEGESASEIARQLGGVTRNAVIGKAHRLGLPPHSLSYHHVNDWPALLRAGLEAGFCAEQLAKTVGVSQSAVIRASQRHGVELRDGRRK